MNFIRENILKIVIFIVVLVVGMILFSIIFNGKNYNEENSYFEYEQIMINATKKYTNDNQRLLPKGDEVSKVNLDTLQNSKYIKEFSSKEDENVKCTGYTEIILKNKKYVYIPYLKCGKYYETKTIAQYIKDKESIVTSNDGLYQYGDSLVFRGENPNNYIGIGNRLYRIIEINGEELKLITTKPFDDQDFLWDDRYNVERNDYSGINDYKKSRLKEYFDNILKNNNPEDKDTLFFTNTELEKMIPHDICIGKRASNNGEINPDNECQVIEKDQKLSLITVSEYARASIDPNCKSIFDYSCVNYNYFSNLSDYIYKLVTLTATADNSYQIYTVMSGAVSLTRASNNFRPYFVIYINNTSLYKSGDGTKDNPYTIR